MMFQNFILDLFFFAKLENILKMPIFIFFLVNEYKISTSLFRCCGLCWKAKANG